MKKLLVIPLLLISLLGSATSYYVATNGNDSNNGAVGTPWLTWQKGFSSIAPGDILYIRGGVYTPSGITLSGSFAAVGINGKKGTSSGMYNVFAYPGEHPVLDCRNLTNETYERIGILLYNCDYWYLKGLEITRTDQSATSGKGGQGLLIHNGNNNKLENIVSHHNGGPGLGLRELCEGNLFLNCDSYSNYDPYSATPGDNADGFDIGFITARPGNDRINTLTGCRAWLNSDDGYDMYQYPGYHPIYYLKNCWAWKNGFRSDGVTKGGNGNGFKYGDDANYALDGVIRRYTYNCIAYANRQRGFSQESADVKMVFYNNMAYKNGSWGFSFYTYDVADVLRNNISYNNTDGAIEGQMTNRIHDHNSWDSGVTVTDADFVSVDASELTTARKNDGSLPDINFLHLATGSDLTDKGVDVGLPYTGTAPDLGAFETLAKSSVTVPVYTSSLIANATPAVIEMTYNMSLADIAPAASSFSVLVNSTARAVSSVAISGTKVLLTIASPVVNGNTVTVSYTKPATNPLQTTTGGMAANISLKPVVNNVAIVIADATPPKIKLTVYPNPVHHILNIQLAASGTISLQTALGSQPLLRISDLSGKLYIEKAISAGVTNFKIALNLKKGIYVVKIYSGALQLATQQIIVL